MREACMAGRLEGIRAQAHAMKGSSHQMGVRLLAEVCLEIETTAEQNRELTTKLVIHAQELFEETCGMMILPSPR
jgi:HPt (histidine-containing phosphotransfer) domain-containing protein